MSKDDDAYGIARRKLPHCFLAVHYLQDGGADRGVSLIPWACTALLMFINGRIMGEDLGIEKSGGIDYVVRGRCMVKDAI